MSSRKLMNLLAILCCGFMLQLDLGEVSAQGPPAIPPPEIGPDGNPVGENPQGGANRGGPPAGASNRGGRPNSRPGGRRGGPSGIMGADMSTEPKKKKPGKFEELLENKDLSRFRGYKTPEIGSGWKMQGKSVHFDGSGGGDIVTVETYDNFELQFDWKISEGGNSGVMYRVSLGDAAPYMSGPEYQVLDDAGHADGKKASTSAGALYAMYEPTEKKPRKAGIWNSTKIIVDGNKITHYLNGTKVVEAEIGSADWNSKLEASKFKDWEKFAKNSSGHIAFQDHGDEVWYRKIRIKRLAGGTSRAQGQARGSQPNTPPPGGLGGPPAGFNDRGGRGGQGRGQAQPQPPAGGLGGPPPGIGDRGGNRGQRGGGTNRLKPAEATTEGGK